MSVRRVFVVLAACVATLTVAGPAAGSFDPSAAARQADTFLQRRGSPLSGLSWLAITKGLACRPQFDGRLLLAITGAETTFGRDWGKFSPASHNAWSWGSSSWASYRAGLRDVARGFCSRYVASGLSTIRKIGPVYVLGVRDSGRTAGWERTVRWSFRQMGGSAVLVPRNPATKQPPPLTGSARVGRRVNTYCAQRILTFGDRGKCVRAIQWLLTGGEPSVRPAKKSHGANSDKSYWRVRDGGFGVYGKATVKQVQLAKWRLGYPSGQANGASGPKFRKYLLGQLDLPKGYRSAEGKRYVGWKAQNNKGSKVVALIHTARYLITQRDRIHYTQTMTGPNGRLSMLLNYARGPPASGQLWADCSGAVEALYIWAGLSDPAGAGAYQAYPGVAVYTGTQAQHGRRVWRAGQSLSLLRPGDLLFYGDPPIFHHVSMYLGNGRAFSHGSEPGPLDLAVLYRSDAYEARRY